ncbi:pyrroline-5-carboxylate reductase 3 isoform X1 [Labeo rohita]|uniref:Pyrroline-5-carboxylate reductase 3 isoform X1 n=1 Tax=Labeo rohita TaxID=84645 RepID=A0A498LCS0_LABRO|nr:pyrroline-5-carboxylate reductase 3 isoform X1 [Labeo rohita]RXN14771.1 pyrroline-5-carboxylate reductase 3 isoform X1 [Labeo rohita]
MEPNGKLHYTCRRKKDKSQHLAKVVFSPKEAHNIFVGFDAGPLGGHCGVEKTHNAIILRFYWPGVEQDICKWIAQCQTRRKSIQEKAAYNPITICHGKVEAMVATEQLSVGLSDRRETMEAVKKNISNSQDNFVVGDKLDPSSYDVLFGAVGDNNHRTLRSSKTLPNRLIMADHVIDGGTAAQISSEDLEQHMENAGD